MTKEIDIQFACNDLLIQLSDIYLFRHYHVANEGKRSVQYQMKLKKMGFRSGVPDFIIEYPKGKILYVELKNEKGQLSKSQKLWKVQSSAFETPHFVVKGSIKKCLEDLVNIVDHHVPRRSQQS
jgi:hypothetical protein|tara:strand:+ start:64 stop:435 length:372 start_codon:yes stop_codon:yes gene_type:complete